MNGKIISIYTIFIISLLLISSFSITSLSQSTKDTKKYDKYILGDQTTIDFGDFIVNYKKGVGAPDYNSFYHGIKNDVTYDPAKLNVQDFTVDNGTVHFSGSGKEYVYVVKASSDYDIKLINFSFKLTHYASDSFEFNDTGSTGGCFDIEKEGDTPGYMVQMMNNEPGNIDQLLYLRLKLLGIFDYKVDKRIKSNFSADQMIFSIGFDLPLSYVYPSGSRYFVFYGGNFDVDQDKVISEWDIWMNFSNDSKDLQFDAYSSGRSYLYSYAGFDANFVKHKMCTDEKMTFGKLKFNINNTFIFDLLTRYPNRNGFWKVNWLTPSGFKRINMTMVDGNLDVYPESFPGILYGSGKHGRYYLFTSYHDYDDPSVAEAHALYFVGHDVELR